MTAVTTRNPGSFFTSRTTVDDFQYFGFAAVAEGCNAARPEIERIWQTRGDFQLKVSTALDVQDDSSGDVKETWITFSAINNAELQNYRSIRTDYRQGVQRRYGYEALPMTAAQPVGALTTMTRRGVEAAAARRESDRWRSLVSLIGEKSVNV